MGQQAIDATSKGHPNRAATLSNLGNGLRIRFEHMEDLDDLNHAITMWTRAAALDVAGAAVRVGAARSAAQASAAVHGPAVAVGLYQVAVDMLPLLAWRGSGSTDNLHLLEREAESPARDGAACAITVGRFDEAVQMLELGRGVLWSQLLDTRTDLAILMVRTRNWLVSFSTAAPSWINPPERGSSQPQIWTRRRAERVWPLTYDMKRRDGLNAVLVQNPVTEVDLHIR